MTYITHKIKCNIEDKKEENTKDKKKIATTNKTKRCTNLQQYTIAKRGRNTTL